MKKSKRRISVVAAGLTATALITAGCGGGEGGSADAGDPVKGGTLNMLGVGDVDYVDPNVTYYSAGYMLARMYSRQLVTFPAVEGKTEEVVADMATELPTTDNGGVSADGKTYTFTIRDGVKWNTSPERAVTADDFVRGIKRTCNPIQPFSAISYLTSLLDGMQKFCDDFQAPYAKEGSKPATAADIEKYVEGTDLPGVEAKDDKTIVFHLTRPASYFVDMLALSAFSPAPVEVLKYAPGSAELGKNQISDGPYKIDKYDPTKTIELSRNPAWDPETDEVRKAYVDKIVISETGEQSNIQKQLELGDKKADMAWDTFPLATDVPALQKKKDKNLTISPTSSSNPYLVYNMASPNNGGAMAKLEFRQGLSHAIDRDNVIQVLGGKTLNAPLTHVLPETILGGKDDYDLYPKDEAKAKDLLKKAGAATPTLKVLYRNESNGSTKTFETLQSDLGKVGIKVEGVSSSNADFYTKYLQQKAQAQKGVWDIAIAGWGADWYGNSALSYFLPLYSGKTSFPPNGSNFGLYEDEEVNKAIEEAAQVDIDQAEAKWAAVDKLVMADAPYYPLTSPRTPNYHAEHLHNTVQMDVFQNYDPTNVWIEKASQD